jgi:hypothetical protein
MIPAQFVTKLGSISIYLIGPAPTLQELLRR